MTFDVDSENPSTREDASKIISVPNADVAGRDQSMVFESKLFMIENRKKVI